VTVPDLQRLDEVLLRDPDGGATTLAASAGDLLVFQLVRYFGCLPCQQWLVKLDRAAPQLHALGARPLAIGGSADYQAQWLHNGRDVTMPLLLDPGQRVRDALQLSPIGVRLLDPRGLASYGRALRAGFRPQRITRDTVQAPGVVIVDTHGEVCWQHIGRRIGDYPPLADVIAAVRGNGGPPR